MGIGDFTPDDATASSQSSGSSSTVDLYGLGPVGNGPIYVTESNPGMGEHSGGGGYTSVPVNGPNVVTGNQYAAQIAALSQSNPAAFQQWQSLLYAADFYSGKPRLGVFGAADINALQAALTAYQQVNGQANASLGGSEPTSPQALQDWLQQRVAQVKATGGPGATTKQPLQVDYTDPTAISAALQAGAQSELGRNLSDKELQGFISQFHGLQATAQTAAYNGDSSFTPPDLSGQAEQYLIGQHGPEHDQKLAAGYLDSIAQRLGVNA